MIAYFTFRKGMPNLISSAFTPLIGEKGVRGPLGKSIDVLAVLATFRVQTSFFAKGLDPSCALRSAKKKHPKVPKD